MHTPLPNPKMPWTKTIGGGSSGDPSKTTTFPLLSSSSLAVRLKMLGLRQCVATWDRSDATAVLKMYNPKSICTIALIKSSVNPRISLAMATTLSFLSSPEFNLVFFFYLVGSSPFLFLSLSDWTGEREKEKMRKRERDGQFVAFLSCFWNFFVWISVQHSVAVFFPFQKAK
jgi:hypothetical protein